MIKLNNICFAYDKKPILKHFNLEINKGEFVIIKGDNGCGKSTLLNIINGLDFPEIGEYTFDNEIINKKTMKNQLFSKSFHQKMGYVFQNTDAQLFCSSVYEELAFGPKQMNLSNDEIENRVNDVLKLMDLEELQNRAPFHLSMGEKKKVAIGAVLTTNPQVIILDEPLNFLDKKSKEWIINFLEQMKDIRKTIIIVSHSNSFDKIADKIINL